MAAGLVVLGFLAYQYWYTDLAAERGQQEGARQLAIRLAEVEPEPSRGHSFRAARCQPTPQQGGHPSAELFTEEPPEPGTAFAEVRIPSIEVEEVVFEGVGRPHAPARARAHAVDPAPGQPGNAVMSGHRTTYGAPFNRIDELGKGDKIVVISAVGRHEYKVRETLVVEPTDIWVTDPRSGGWITLTTCHPEFSAQERYIVHAEMIKGPNLEYVRANPRPPTGGGATGLKPSAGQFLQYLEQLLLGYPAGDLSHHGPVGGDGHRHRQPERLVGRGHVPGVVEAKRETDSDFLSEFARCRLLVFHGDTEEMPPRGARQPPGRTRVVRRGRGCTTKPKG